MSLPIDIYTSETAPAHRRFMACLVIRDSVTMVWRGPTEDSVRQSAQDFWNGELAKEQAKADAAAKRAEARKARAVA